MFDYQKAYQKLAKPAFDQLSSPVQDLVQRVKLVASNASQASDLSLPWANEELKRAFHELAVTNLRGLCWASYVVYCAGHWAPSGAALHYMGLYWKFSRYADQTIESMLDLPWVRGEHRRRHSIRVRLGVYEGVLRAYYELYDQEYSFAEIGLATKEVYHSTHKAMTGFNLNILSSSTFHKVCERLRKSAPMDAQLWDLTPYK